MQRRVFRDYSLKDFLLGSYIIAIPFQRAVWNLPFLGKTIQPAEFLLGVLLLYSLVLVFSGRVRYWFSPLDIAALLWLAANIVSNAIAGFNDHLLLETTKVFAVVLIYFIFRLLMSDDFLDKIPDAFLFSAFIASLLAIAGSILSLFGNQTVLSAQMQTYPYIGKIGRAMAFTSTPNMLGSILMTALLLKSAQLIGKKSIKTKEAIALAICLLAFIAAISKTILCFLLGLVAILLLKTGKKSLGFRLSLLSAMAIIIVLYLVGSHFVFTRELTPRIQDNMRQGHITPVYHEVGPILAVETSYLTIKRSCLHLIKNHFPWGIGTRNFKVRVPLLKKEGIYNKETKAFDPHCTPLGTLTELGLLGGIALVILFLQICRGLLSVQRKKIFLFHHLNMGLIAIFVALSLEGWVTDIMNFRHYWLLLAVLAIMARQANRHDSQAAA